MRYEVPQFIDIEDKIFGPLTFKQAIYLAGSFGMSFIVFYILGNIFPEMSPLIKIAIASPFMALGVAMAFVKINKRPFIDFLESVFYYSIRSKRYIWKKRVNKDGRKRHRFIPEDLKKNNQTAIIPKVTRSKLKDLAWSLDMDLDNNNNNN